MADVEKAKEKAAAGAATPHLEESTTAAEHKDVTELSGFRIDISHQEVERILSEVEAYYQVVKDSGGEWVLLGGMPELLAHDLGYEDQDEFEDALKGTLDQFLSMFPHVEIKKRESDEKVVFRIVTPPAPEGEIPTKLTLHVKERKDLWRVCLKSERGRIEIPELEFEIGADLKRDIDTVYNHIANAVFQLGTTIRESKAYDDTQKGFIMETMDSLNQALDVETPFTFVVHDPSGRSDFKPFDGIEVEYTQVKKANAGAPADAAAEEADAQPATTSS